MTPAQWNKLAAVIGDAPTDRVRTARTPTRAVQVLMETKAVGRTEMLDMLQDFIMEKRLEDEALAFVLDTVISQGEDK